MTSTTTLIEQAFGLGIAGNFAGHLEQAGETPDFVAVETPSKFAPKGLFPFYIPFSNSSLSLNPYSDTTLKYPELASDAHLQAEPEVCVLFNVRYQFGQVAKLTPTAFAAFNDASIRKPNAKKISEKKHWGPNSKGLSSQWIPVTSLQPRQTLDQFRIVSYLKRDQTWHLYGQDSAVASYSYFHDTLMNWMQDKLNHQADFGPLENLNQLIHQAKFPKQLLISLGATTYTEFGQNTFLQIGDEILIMVYNQTHITQQMIEEYLHHHRLQALKNLPAGQISLLHQVVIS